MDSVEGKAMDPVKERPRSQRTGVFGCLLGVVLGALTGIVVGLLVGIGIALAFGVL